MLTGPIGVQRIGKISDPSGAIRKSIDEVRPAQGTLPERFQMRLQQVHVRPDIDACLSHPPTTALCVLIALSHLAVAQLERAPDANQLPDAYGPSLGEAARRAEQEAFAVAIFPHDQGSRPIR